MKVSTDACIQGAWTPVDSFVKTVLDIGAGTGLLSLMLAQRNKYAQIDAIEIDQEAAQQAKENIESAPWNSRINVIANDATEHVFEKKYDLIICNPPFFINSLLSDKEERNTARHNLFLSLEALFPILQNHLSPNGCASILLPVTEHGQWKQILTKNNWKIFHELHVIPGINKKANRIVSLCSSNIFKQETAEDLIIRNRDNSYTPEFIHLMKPFYSSI